MDNVTSIQSSHIFTDHSILTDQVLHMDFGLLHLQHLHPDQGGLQVTLGPPPAVLVGQGGFSQHPKVQRLLAALMLHLPRHL